MYDVMLCHIYSEHQAKKIKNKINESLWSSKWQDYTFGNNLYIQIFYTYLTEMYYLHYEANEAILYLDISIIILSVKWYITISSKSLYQLSTCVICSEWGKLRH